MSDENRNDENSPAGDAENQEKTTEGQEPQGSVQGEAVNDGADDRGTGDGGEELDAEALRAQLTEARKDAAKYRTRSREQAEALAKAKSPEDFQAVADRAAQFERELNVERALRKHQIPEELVEYLKGDTAEELEESAKTLARFASRQAPTLNGGGGGLDPSTKSTPSNPADLAARIPRARR